MAKVTLTHRNMKDIVSECVYRAMEELYESRICEDLTRGQIDDQIEDYVKSKAFEKRVNNIVVDVLGGFIENMWTKKSFWKTMLKKM